MRSFGKGLSLTQYYGYYYMKLFKSPTSSTLNHASCSHTRAKIEFGENTFYLFQNRNKPEW